jgi:plasmid replication initiation protein
MLVSTNRYTGGRNYKLLADSFKRLRGTGIETTIKTNGKEQTKGFGLIESYEVIREDSKKRMIDVEITLSEWLYEAVVGKEVVTINREYFRLRKPIERRIYEIARKHCNRKAEWSIAVDKLHKKVGSSGTVRKFKLMLKSIIDNNHLPDYATKLEGNIVVFSSKKEFKRAIEADRDKPRISSKTIENVKKLVINKFDVYQLEAEWLDFWQNSGSPELKNVNAAFTAFAKKKILD